MASIEMVKLEGETRAGARSDGPRGGGVTAIAVEPRRGERGARLDERISRVARP
jgi:hypothetical protein